MKRFTETSKWADPWFRKLPVEYKAFWSYLCDNCDASGVWVVDIELASFHIGHTFNEKDTLKAFGERVERLDDEHWWIPKFVAFQCGELSPACKPHLKIISLLKKRGLLDRVSKGYPKGINTLEEEEEEKEEEGGGYVGNGRFKPTEEKSAWKIQKALEAKEKLANSLKHRFSFCDAMGDQWRDRAKQAEYLTLRKEIRVLTERMAKTV